VEGGPIITASKFADQFSKSEPCEAYVTLSQSASSNEPHLHPTHTPLTRRQPHSQLSTGHSLTINYHHFRQGVSSDTPVSHRVPPLSRCTQRPISRQSTPKPTGLYSIADKGRPRTSPGRARRTLYQSDYATHSAPWHQPRSESP
jgi:hypothetical protein